MDRLLAAIMTGALTHREARVMLAVAAGEAWSAGSAARATGLDRAHCTRALAALAEAGWLTRDGTGRVVPKEHQVVPKEHQVVPKEHQGGGAETAPPGAERAPPPGAETAPPTRMGGADTAPPPVPKEHHTPAPDGACAGVVPKEHHRLARARGCGGGFLITTTTTTPGEKEGCGEEEGAPPPDPGSPTADAEALVFPRGFTPELQAAARRLLAGVGGQAQALLDEVAGRAALRPISNPLAYLGRLVAVAKAGDFRPEAGPAVAEARRIARARERTRKENDDAHARLCAEAAARRPPPPEFAAALARLAQPRHAGRAP